MSVDGFRSLDVYQRAYQLALEIHQISINFPKHEQFALSSQIRRSSKSVCAQIAEGHGKSYTSKAEFKRYISIAIGSCDETGVWLDFAKDLNYIDIEKHTHLIETVKTTCKQLHKLSQSLR